MEPNPAQTELMQAVDALAREMPRLSTAEACARIARLRAAATRHGFAPTASLAAGLGEALTRDRRRAPLGAWLDALALAARCGDAEGATPSLLASVAVRNAA